jgi:hypothetical protein
MASNTSRRSNQDRQALPAEKDILFRLKTALLLLINYSTLPFRISNYEKIHLYPRRCRVPCGVRAKNRDNPTGGKSSRHASALSE